MYHEVNHFFNTEEVNWLRILQRYLCLILGSVVDFETWGKRKVTVDSLERRCVSYNRINFRFWLFVTTTSYLLQYEIITLDMRILVIFKILDFCVHSGDFRRKTGFLYKSPILKSPECAAHSGDFSTTLVGEVVFLTHFNK